MRRYPHTAYLTVKPTERDENGDLITDGTKSEIKGRFQVVSGGGKMVDYDAKFFTPKMNVEAFSLDEADLEYEGKKFKIVKHFDYQTHTVLWLV